MAERQYISSKVFMLLERFYILCNKHDFSEFSNDNLEIMSCILCIQSPWNHLLLQSQLLVCLHHLWKWGGWNLCSPFGNSSSSVILDGNILWTSIVKSFHRFSVVWTLMLVILTHEYGLIWTTINYSHSICLIFTSFHLPIINFFSYFCWRKASPKYEAATTMGTLWSDMLVFDGHAKILITSDQSKWDFLWFYFSNGFPFIILLLRPDLWIVMNACAVCRSQRHRQSYRWCLGCLFDYCLLYPACQFRRTDLIVLQLCQTFSISRIWIEERPMRCSKLEIMFHNVILL